MHGVEVDMTIWWVASVTPLPPPPPLKNPGYAPRYDSYLPVGLANVLSEGRLHYSTVSSSLRLEETAEIHPQVKLHCFVSLSGKQNKNNDNKKRNISFASWGFITWIFDSLIDNSEVLISCLLDTSFFLMSSDLETARFSWTKINYSFILYLFQGVFFRYHQAGFRSTVFFFLLSWV